MAFGSVTPVAETLFGRFLQAFFFSVQTSSTIGYGHIRPGNTAADVLVAVESFVSIIGLAVITGLVFARFSRPNARIVFSENAVVAPYRGGPGWMFRMINGRRSELIELKVKGIFSRIRMADGMRLREFHELPLERDFVAFLPMNWTVVHPIDEESPLRGETPESLAAAEAEWLIYLTGIDETFNQMVVVRSSYRAPEVIFGAKFRRIFEYPEEGPLRIDVRRIHEVDRVDL